MSSNPFEPASETSVPAPKPQRFKLVELLVVVAIIGILVGLLLPARRTAREAARRMQCSNNLKQLALAMHYYHETFGSFPPAYTVDAAGNRLHSWRTLLLPYMEQKHLYDRIDLTKPWDDPANLKATEGENPVFTCPSSKDRTRTYYQVVVDPDGCFTGKGSVARRAILDGPSNTLLILEAPEGSAVDWRSPNDLDWEVVAQINEKTKTTHLGGSMMAMADGSVRVLTLTSTEEDRRALVTKAAGDQVQLEDQ